MDERKSAKKIFDSVNFITATALSIGLVFGFRSYSDITEGVRVQREYIEAQIADVRRSLERDIERLERRVERLEDSRRGQ